MFIFGGRDNNQVSKNDLYMYNFRTNKWVEIKAKEEDVWPNARHSCLINVMTDRMYIFGGKDDKIRYNDLYYLDLLTYKWAQVPFEKENSFAGGSYTTPSKNYLKDDNGDEVHVLKTCFNLREPNDLSKFINKKKYSDIKLVIKRRHVIRAHKIILAK